MTSIPKASGTAPQSLKLPRWSRLVSDIISPPVVWAVLSLPVALKYTDTLEQALIWGALFSFWICLVPISYVFIQVARGKIGDIHMEQRQERYIPLLITMGSSALVAALLHHLGAPPALVLLALLSLVQVSIIALITFAWQISMHTMSITGVTVASGVIFHLMVGILLVPLVLLVSAARLHLKRHTPAQILAGTLVGGLVPAVLLLLLATTL